MEHATDARVARLATPHECRVFERNARDRGRADLAEQARARWIELNAAGDIEADPEADSDPLRRHLWTALAACEYVSGRRLTGPRQSIRRRGLVGAGEHFAGRGELPVALGELADAGLLEHAWEQVVVHHPERFSAATAESARERLSACEQREEAPAEQD